MKFVFTAAVLMFTSHAFAADSMNCSLQATGRYINSNGKLGSVIERDTQEYFQYNRDICKAVTANNFYSSAMFNSLCSKYGQIAVVFTAKFKTVVSGVSKSETFASYTHYCPMQIPGGEGGGGDGGGGGGM